MYKNGKEFLRNEIDEQDLVPDERCEYDWIVNWWKEKAIRRYLNLHSKNNISFNNYWFDNMTKDDVDQYLTAGGVVSQLVFNLKQKFFTNAVGQRFKTQVRIKVYENK